MCHWDHLIEVNKSKVNKLIRSSDQVIKPSGDQEKPCHAELAWLLLPKSIDFVQNAWFPTASNHHGVGTGLLRRVAPRNDSLRSSGNQEKSCHPEFISGSSPDAYGKSKTNIISSMSERTGGKIPNQVRNDILVGTISNNQKLKSPDHFDHSRREDDLITSKTLKLSSLIKQKAPTPTLPHKGGRKAAFTLAEVLITLGIIGVVAAMTLPTLIQNYQTKAKVTALSKAQSVLSQAVLMLANENGGTLAELCNTDEDHNCFAEKLAKHTKNIKYCSANSENEFCKNIYYPNRPHIFLSDGSILEVYHGKNDCGKELVETGSAVYLPEVEICGAIIVDYNGLKAPNTRGEDGFGFAVLKNGKISAWGAPTLFVEAKRHPASYCTNKNNPFYERQYCTYCYLYGDCK